ncbi:type iii restriction-modification systemmethyltransferase [Bathymodiolus azoricus thioautotrophic gill symbiont]|uniref:site-specific DNA-methyltransferase (adenine-specific) n=2 Tax=Bathymodiolus azoricus thioautotrophic gill symbiont TaxID=235205 RepID=A0A1H6M4P6_9GAMM|nr:type iii restriction-modification systemmethyltransferase [Bathymodiolus azoricus thioautotrophic gill symbiont]
MDWLGKSYARLLATDETTTLLKEDETFNQKPENANSENLLIKGDNLEVLKHLSNAYYEKIKMIYIDPPYNTGSDGFVYADDRKFTKDELQELAGISEERAKRILDFTQSNSNSHSAWLTFIYPRLYIAKQLLKDDGVIFISIDDNEVAQLRLLMDEIFGEENFVNKIVWKKNSSGKTVSEKYPENIDYILMFSKSGHYELENIYKPLAESTIKMYSKDDNNDGRGKYRLYPLQKTGSPGPETTYDYVDNSGKIWKCPKKGWRINKNKMKSLENDNRLYLKNDKLNEKAYWNERENDGQIADTLWDDMPENNVGTAEVDKLLGKAIFTNPKPTGLIKRCIKTIIKQDDLILDFFAGSGTTADAVMQLNAEDGGNRKFYFSTTTRKHRPKEKQNRLRFCKRWVKSSRTYHF